MLDYLYQWIRGIAYYMVLVTVIMQLAAGQSYRKYIRLFTGIILVLLILAPVTRLLGIRGEGTVLSAEIGFEEAAEEIEEKIREMEQEALPEIQSGNPAEGETADRMAEQSADSGQEEETGLIEVEEIRIGR